MKTRHIVGSVVAALLALAAQSALALEAPQTGQAPAIPRVPGTDFPLPPTGLEGQPLGPGPWTYRTAEQQDIRVSVWAKGLTYPFSLAFLPDGELLVTERTGRLRSIRGGVVNPVPIPGGPASRFAGKSGGVGAVHGYMSLVIHPRFAENRLVYFSYTKAVGDSGRAVAVARARYADGRLQDVKDLLMDPAVRGSAMLAFGRDGMLYVATTGDDAQDPSKLGGKVLRLKDDGSVPADNPFAAKSGTRSEIFTLGHRSALGLAMHPGNGQLYLSEMGPNGGDEINLLKAGANYGWPLVSLGRTYPGPWQVKGNGPTHEGFEPPVVYWTPSISVSGLTFYTGDALPRWKNNLFVGGVRYGEVPGTGRLDRVLFNAGGEELRRETLLTDLHQRIRDVKQGPDGLLYVATDEEDGVILRIEPATK
jgi:glucose/arabinose dehydrogenase